MPTVAVFMPKAGNRITDCEMVHNLPLLGREVETAVHLFVVKRANAGCRQAEGFRRDIEPVADSAGFKMHVAVATLTIRADSTVKIAIIERATHALPARSCP